MQTDELTNSIRAFIKEINPDFEGCPDQDFVTFTELGLDSLDQMSLVMDVQEKSGVIIDDESLEGLDCISKIVAYVNQC